MSPEFLRTGKNLLAIFLVVLFASRANSQYPEEQIRYIVHVQPGGAADVLARKLAAGLRDELGQNIIVENRPGGRSARQMAVLTRADADGYTIGSVTASHIVAFNQFLARYDIDSIEWVARLVVDPYVIAVGAESPIKSLRDLVAFVQENPGELQVAGFYDGSGGHIAWEIFANVAGISRRDVRWIPYDSVNQAVTAVLGGHADVTVSYVGLVRGHVTTSRLRVLGIMADEPPELLPDIPTFRQAGFDVDTSWQQFRGLVAPKGMPADHKARLAAAVENVMAQTNFQQYLTDAQLNYGFMGPEQFEAFVQRQNVSAQDWLKELGLME